MNTKLDEQLTSHGYGISETGGGCTAYTKIADENDSYFILTICYKNDSLDLGYETDASHPEEWPVYFGLCDGEADYIVKSIMNPVIHNMKDLIKAEVWALKNKKDLEQY